MSASMISEATKEPEKVSQKETEATQKPFEAFCTVLKEELDDKIGQVIFVDLCKAIFRDCKVVDFKKETGGNYRLTLDYAYVAARDDGEGKTWHIEKEIVTQLNPDKFEIIFPKVLELKERKGKIDQKDIDERNLNAFWASETHLGSLYTGVGYSLRWDASEAKVVSDNINDLGWMLPQALATPRVKTFSKATQEWNDRGRVSVI